MTTQIVTLVLADMLGSFYNMPQGRIFRRGAENDPERARLLPASEVEVGNGQEGPRLLPADEAENTERRGPTNARGTEGRDDNPWEGE